MSYGQASPDPCKRGTIRRSKCSKARKGMMLDQQVAAGASFTCWKLAVVLVEKDDIDG